MRFETTEIDTEDFWNACMDPKRQPHWRRPSTDQVVEFCEKKGIRRHGHPLVWGNPTWHYPIWLLAKLPKECLVDLHCDHRTRRPENIWERSPVEIAARYPEYTRELSSAVERRIQTIAAHYGNRIQSWDVCNESGNDFQHGKLIPGDPLCKSTYYRFMPGDYAFNAFDIANNAFPKDVKLNINDYKIGPAYSAQIRDMLERGSRIDIVGAQMHIFDQQICLDIADGRLGELAPEKIRAKICAIGETGLPVHLSEITIPAPDNSGRGMDIQAVLTRDLYRLWFSLKPTMGITWWNVVDDCGAPGEPCVSGLFTLDMNPKPSALVLDGLINGEWMTKLELRTGKDGRIAFRGFRGNYRLSWIDKDGVHEKNIAVK